MKIKKLLLLFLFLIIVLLFMPSIVNAATTIDNFNYELSSTDNSATVVSIINPEENIVIPSSIIYDGEEYEVNSIGENAFAYCSLLKSINLPNTIIKIENQAFLECTALESITIPNSVVEIGESAFMYCTSLRYIQLPNAVKEIGMQAFCDCISLESIVIPNSVTVISADMFNNCTALKSINLPNTITKIENQAFVECTSLEGITIPNSVTEIEMSAFMDCTSLKQITIPDTVTKISRQLFSNCTSLESITIPNTITSIDMLAFSKCIALESITIPNSVINIGDYAFNKCSSNLKIIAYPNSCAETFANENNINFVGIYAITVNISDGANILIRDKVITSTFVEDIKGNETIEVEITAKKGYIIKSVRVNNVEQTLSGNILVLENVTENKNVIVKTALETYTITFNANGGTGNMDEQTFTYGNEKAVLTNEFIKDGYIFKEWNTKIDGSGKVYSDKQMIFLDEDITFYAQWEEIQEDITDKGENNNVASGKNPQTGDNIVLFVIMFAVAVIGIGVTTKFIKYSKTK